MMLHDDGTYKYSELISQINSLALNIHKRLGNGFQKVIYKRALALEFNLNNIPFKREVEMGVFYKKEKIGSRRIDFLIDNKISIEIITTSQLEKEQLAQAIYYLEAYNLKVGLIINFGNKNLEFERLVNKKNQNLS